MKIIKAGKLPGKTIRRATCPDCGCRFEFELREARFETDRNESCLVVKCPQTGCTKDVWIAT
jgi:RNase P subunit RPR2